MRRTLALRQAYAYLAIALVGGGLVAYCTGCLSLEERYTAALLLCVEQAKTLAESKSCRRVVDGEYGIAQTVRKDGGE